jgi:8-oxo-dGTP pyrophosphatase MutT (NUDIX family)
VPGRGATRLRQPLPTRHQVSAGGVAYRLTGGAAEVALVLVGPQARSRWQLSKGLVEEGETPEECALREVREEAGIETELVAPLDRVEYWYYGTEAETALPRG